MKTSNKIIALVFGLLILIPALVVATIMIRYKNGEYTRVEEGSSSFKTASLASYNSIRVQGFSKVYIYPSDSFYVEYSSIRKDHPVIFRSMGDSVFLYGDSAFITERDSLARSLNIVNMYLPSTRALTAVQCNVELKRSKQDGDTKDLDLRLFHSYLGVEEKNVDKLPIVVRNLNITGSNSEILLSKLCQIEKLNIILKNESILNAGKAQVGMFVIDADASTDLHFSGLQLQRITQKK